VSTFTMRGVFIGVNGTSTDLERSVWSQVKAGQPSHMAGRSGVGTSTDSAFSSSCRHVATKAHAKPPQTLADWPRSWAGRLAPGPTRRGVWPTWSADWPLGPLGVGSGPLGRCVKYTPVVMMILTFGQLHFVIP
jgi:hypothetical protein